MRVSCVPGNVDHKLPVSRQKSSNLPYRDMAGCSAWSSASRGAGTVQKRGLSSGIQRLMEGEIGAAVIGSGREGGQQRVKSKLWKDDAVQRR